MRLKQLLGIVLSLVVCMTGAAAGSQLTDIRVATEANATTVTIQATGAFTHTEYRPTDHLLMVDMTGVSAARLDGRTQNVHAPGVVSYRVMGYKGVGGAEVARLELTLSPNATVSFQESAGQLAVRVQPADSYGPADVAKPGALEQAKQKAVRPVAAAAPAASRPVTVRNVSVAKDGTVEILANGPLAPKAMKLSGPDRVVIDLPNAVPVGKGRELNVDGETVKTVRMARYQVEPPVTRVVVDLKSAKDFELQPSGNKLRVKLSEPTLAKTETPPETKPENQPAETAAAETKPETKPAQPATSEFVAVNLEEKPAPVAAPALKLVAATSPTPYNVPTTAAMQPQQAVNLAAQQAAAGGPAPVPQGPQSCSRTRYTGEPISVNLKDVDLKDFFRLVHEISGLNIVIDPNVRGSVTLVLDQVPWDQALNIVLKNNGLECELEGNVLRIATLDTLKKEADAQRAQKEARALAVPKVTQTIFLSYAHAKELVPTIKKFLSPRGEVISDDRLNALIIEDIPSYLPAVNALIKQLDFKTQEVEIEARVVAATRTFSQDFGTQFGFRWNNTPTTLVGTLGTSSISGTPVPLFSNMPAGSSTAPATGGIGISTGAGNYRLDFILTMAERRGMLKILSRPRVVTQNNIPAVVQQGVKIPVVTQAQLSGPPTVQYVDAFLRLSVTPQITMENTIFLNIDVENTTPDFGNSIDGNPTLLTQQAKTQVLVTDGGTVMIGGVIRTTNNVTVRQVPFLGDIPILGLLFKAKSVSTDTQELLFFITPKIVQT